MQKSNELQNNYIYFIKKYHPHWITTNIVTFPKKYIFIEILVNNLFFLTKCSFAPKTKTNIFFWQCHLKAEGRIISEHPGVIPWPKNLMKKLLCEHRQCSFTGLKNAIFALFINIKPVFTMKKEIHHSKWLTALERYDWDSFCLVLESQPNLILVLYFLQCSGHYVVPIFCKPL